MKDAREELLSRREVAAIVGVDPVSVHTWIHQGIIPVAARTLPDRNGKDFIKKSVAEEIVRLRIEKPRGWYLDASWAKKVSSAPVPFDPKSALPAGEANEEF